MLAYIPVRPGWRPYYAATVTENGPRARQGRHKHVGNARHRAMVAMVAMVANDRRVTAFVLSMFKTNTKVLRSDLERSENAVGSRRS